jgi:hypothetical protein
MANNKPSIQDRIALWMRGRNGADALAVTCIWLAVILYLIGLASRLMLFSILAFALLIYAWMRMSSRSLAARAKENRLFLSKLGPVRPWIQDPVAAWREFRAYRHLTCPECGQHVRVPRGRGKIRVSCPTCHHKFEAKS